MELRAQESGRGDPGPALRAPALPARTAVHTLLLTDLVGSTKLVERCGDARAAEVFAQQDRIARDLLLAHGGREIDKTDGFLHLFERPVDAVRYALAYHEGLRRLSAELSIPLSARVGIHLGELVVIENAPGDVARGAKPVEVEGIAKPLAARIMSLARGGQTLMTRAAFDLARRAVVGDAAAPAGTAWMAHGPYLLKGCEDPVEVFEVGVEGAAPLEAPADTEKARRSVAAGDEQTLGWRPAAGRQVPQRSGWVLAEKLGEGGFGEVWLARNQATRDRRVFKFCFDAHRLRSLKRELTLFRLLRDALGDRKDIARLHEVQLEEAPFFLESEYTPSGSLLDWANSAGGIDTVEPEARIEFVARTARAVAAAHSVGIVHKDIKPGNILVYLNPEGRPRPRLSDFGIGALTDRGELDRRDITVAGFSSLSSATPAGTRLYAPPESLAGKPVTLLGDVYALGVLLYQMIVGDLDRPLAPGWERDVTDPVLREDVAVCVEGDEQQRLGSAQGLAKRLEALPARRRAQRRRHRARIVLSAASVLAVLGVVAMLWGVRERNLRNRKDEALAYVLDVLPFAIDPYNQGAHQAEVLRGIMTGLEAGLADDPEDEAALLHVVGSTYRGLSMLEEARAPLERALAIRRAALAPPDGALAESIDEYGEWLEDVARYDQAEAGYAEALEMRRALARRSGAADDRLRIADSIQHLAALLRKTGRPADAEPLFREALAIRGGLLPPHHRDLARSINNLGVCLLDLDRYAEAMELFQQALPVFESIYGRLHLQVAGTRGLIGRCLMELKRYEEARPLLERAVAEKRELFTTAAGTTPHRSLAKSLHHLGDFCLRTGDLASARRYLGEALEMRRAVLAAGDREIAETEHLLARCRQRLDAANAARSPGSPSGGG